MAISAEELAAIRDEIGPADPPSDADLTAMFDRLSSVAAVAYAVLTSRLASLTAEAAKVDVAGVYSHDLSVNIAALRSSITRVGTSLPPALPALSVGRFARSDRDPVSGR